MQRLAELQEQFARAILDPEAPVPAGVIGPDRLSSARRFGVYRNNVVVGLVDALEDGYPAVAKIVGEEFFRAMARLFVSHHPPTSPVMLEYGDGFADFIANFAPAESLPYLADVARIERAWVEAYHAQDATPLAGKDLAHIDEVHLPKLGLVLHPAVRFLKSSYPALTIWQMNVEDDVKELDFTKGGEEVLICRPEYEVNAYPLPFGTVDFLKGLKMGASLEKAAQSAWSEHPDFEITRALTGLIECGAFIGWNSPITQIQTLQGVAQND